MDDITQDWVGGLTDSLKPATIPTLKSLSNHNKINVLLNTFFCYDREKGA
jgi:hypothetical protein